MKKRTPQEMRESYHALSALEGEHLRFLVRKKEEAKSAAGPEEA